MALILSLRFPPALFSLFLAERFVLVDAADADTAADAVSVSYCVCLASVLCLFRVYLCRAFSQAASVRGSVFFSDRLLFVKSEYRCLYNNYSTRFRNL